MSLLPGEHIGRYAIEQQIGAGGMAVVYKARHVELGSMHAIKVLHLTAPKLQERALQEGRIQASLQHPNVVRVTDVLRLPGGAPALVMEFVDGPSLEDLLQTEPPDLAAVDRIAIGILRGVAAAHRQGLVHRDLKPDNVLLTKGDDGWDPKITDFGLAKVLSDIVESKPHATRSGIMMGTPDYMAPEQVRSAKDVDHRADIFALGALLYRVVTRVPPFQGADMLEVLSAVSTASFTPVRQLAPRAPERIIEAIEGALKVDPVARWPSCQVMLEAWQGQRSRITPYVPTYDPTAAPSLPGLAALPQAPDDARARRLATDASVGTVAPELEDWEQHSGKQPGVRPSELPASLALTTPPPSASPLIDRLPPEAPSESNVDAELAAIRGPRRGPLLVAALLLLALLGLGLWSLGDDPAISATPDPGEREAVAEPGGAGEPEALTPEAVEVLEASPEDPGIAMGEAQGSPEAPEATPVPAVAPPPTAEAAPRPALTVTERPVAAAPKASAGASVVLNGDWRGYLIGGDGNRYKLSEGVGAGSYELWIFFDATKPTRVGSVALAAGEVKDIKCSEGAKSCALR
ncbi:MAG: serine/threonine protein kinase [Alphaproteobacteria bacterium]|nr:serine/threonine protein kinase [Alphaproteobacteria bacterium]